MKKKAAPIPFAGSQLDESRHVCAFFNSDDEEYRVLLPFIKDGFECGDRAVHVVNPDQHEGHLQRLASVGIDIEAARKSGQLDLRTNTDEYLLDGKFDQDRMLEAFELVANGAPKSGFPLNRIVCHMDWAAEGRSHIDNLVEFESRVNDVWSRHDDAVICTYKLGQFGGDMVIDIMRTHPMVIIGGILQQNPFFVPPDEFLREFRERRDRKAAARSTTA
jgi:MEDS: MEthanogen/methylotroph, DcmR Sensory domain